MRLVTADHGCQLLGKTSLTNLTSVDGVTSSSEPTLTVVLLTARTSPRRWVPYEPTSAIATVTVTSTQGPSERSEPERRT